MISLRFEMVNMALWPVLGIVAAMGILYLISQYGW